MQSWKGEHVNKVHIAVPTQDSGPPRKYLALSVASLPGGTTDDYVGHIDSVLKNISNSHKDFHLVSLSELDAGAKITSCISDHVSVNHCVAPQLKQRDIVDSSMEELNCNVHPLNLISSKAQAALKLVGNKGKTYGGDCAAANLLHGLYKLRWKQVSFFLNVLKPNSWQVTKYT